MAEIIHLENEFVAQCAACGCQTFYIAFDSPDLSSTNFCYLVCSECGRMVVKDEDQGWMSVQ